MKSGGQKTDASWGVTFLPPVNIQAGIEEALVREQIRSENFRINYETLKSLHIRLRNQIISAQPEILDLELYRKKDFPIEKKSEYSRDRELAGPSKAVQTCQLPLEQEKSVRELKLALEAQPGNEDLKALYFSILNQYKTYKDNTYGVMKKLTEEYDQMLEVIRVKFQFRLDQSVLELSETSCENRKLTREAVRLRSEVDILKAEMERMVNELAQPVSTNPKKSKLEECIEIHAHHDKCQLELRMSRQREEALTKELAARETHLEEAIQKLTDERNDHIVEVRSLQSELDRSELTQAQMKSNLNCKISEINATIQEQVKHTEKLTKFVDEREYGYAEAKEELSQFVSEIMRNSNELVHCLQKSVEASRKDSEHVNECMADLQRKAHDYQDLPKKYASLINSANERVIETILSCTSFETTCNNMNTENGLNEENRENNFELTFQNSQKKINTMLHYLMSYRQEMTDTICRCRKRVSSLESKLSKQRDINLEILEKLKMDVKTIRDYRHAARKHRSLLRNIQSQRIEDRNEEALKVMCTTSSSEGAMNSSVLWQSHFSSASASPEPKSPFSNSKHPRLLLQNSPEPKLLGATSTVDNPLVPKSGAITETSVPPYFGNSSRLTHPTLHSSIVADQDERNELMYRNTRSGNTLRSRTTQQRNLEIDGGSGDTGRPQGELIQHLKFVQVLYGSDPDLNHH